MEPYYRSWHDRQAVRLEGPDLTVAWRCEITSSAEDISPDSILQFNHIQFHVASQSHPGEYYAIDLHQPACDCTDFPRIQFCKHIAAIYTHFPHLSPEGINSSVLTKDITSSFQPERAPSQEDTLQNLTQDIAALSYTLTSKSSSSAILEATHSAKYMLMAAMAGLNTLPEKDIIVPNQKSWMETAKRMGVKHRAPKRKCLPKERGMTVQSIGVAKGKCHLVHSDLYAGGERSGKRAKPDATSTAANACARACAVPPSATAPSPSVLPTETFVPPSTTAPTPSMHPETQGPPSALALAFALPSQSTCAFASQFAPSQSVPVPPFVLPSQSAPMLPSQSVPALPSQSAPALPSFVPTTRMCVDTPL
jgi:hypothetical protein